MWVFLAGLERFVQTFVARLSGADILQEHFVFQARDSNPANPVAILGSLAKDLRHAR